MIRVRWFWPQAWINLRYNRRFLFAGRNLEWPHGTMTWWWVMVGPLEIASVGKVNR